MLRTNRIELIPTKNQKNILKEMLVRSSGIWNLTNYEKRQAFFKKEKIPSFSQQCKELRHHELYKKLGSAYSQQILKKLDNAWHSFWETLKSNKISNNVSIPSYFKNYKTNQTFPKLLICRNDCYRIDEKYIYISCSKDLKKKHGIKGLMKIRYNGARKWKGEQRSMEIKYFSYIKKFYAYQTEKVEPISIKSEEENICSIDLGIKRYMSAYVKNGKDFNLLYPSEHIFKDYLNITKKIARYQAIAKRENGRYSTKRIQRLFLKRKRKLENYMNNIIAHLIRKLKYYKVSNLIIGDLKGIRVSTIPQYFKYKEKINMMIQNFWSFDLFKKKLQNKCEEFGINLIVIDESHTSSTCPICGNISRPNDRNFKCSYCGYEQDRDVVGSINLLKKYSHDQGLHLGVENHPVLSNVIILH